jgi:serralysin
MATIPLKSATMPRQGSSLIDALQPCRFESYETPALTPASAASGIAFAAVMADTVWNKQELTVGFLEPDPPSTPGLISLIQNLAPRWLEGTCLRFRFLMPGWQNADIRISFNSSKGFWSWLGSSSASGSRNVPSMNLGFDARTFADERDRQRLILHEFGHSLGLAHEHQHAGGMIDVEKAIAYYRANSSLGSLPEADLRAQFEQIPEQKLHPASSSFDPASVMLYPFPAGIFSYGATSYNYELSELDRQTIRKIYPRATTLRHARPGMELKVRNATDQNPLKIAYYLFGKDEALFYFKVDQPGEFQFQMTDHENSGQVLDPLHSISELPADTMLSERLLSGTSFQLFAESRIEWQPGDPVPNGSWKYDLLESLSNATSHKIVLNKPGFYYMKAYSHSQDARAMFRFVPSVVSTRNP